MSDSKQEQTEETGESGSSFEPLNLAMDGIQNSLGSVLENLAQNLQNNMAAVKSLGSAIDNMIRSNVIISSYLKPIKDGVQLTVRIENKTAFPLLRVKGKIVFDSDQEISVENTDSYFIVIDKEDSQEVEEIVPSLFENPTNLESKSKYEQVSIIKPQEPTYTVGKIRLSFLHPTRGEEIVIEEPFGLYIIDQLIKSLRTEDLKEGDINAIDSIKRVYHVGFIREMMEIHPIKGMDKGMCITLSGKKFEALCKVVDFSGDYTTCQVEFLLKSGDSIILDRVIYELDSLSQLE